MKYTVSFLLLIFVFYSCQERKKDEPDEKKVVFEASNISLIDSLKSDCPKNTIDPFDIGKLETD